MSDKELIYICDKNRHLICEPYSIDNLHKMAKSLKIGKWWFHKKDKFSHYDIPKKRVDEIMSKCIVVSSKEIINIIKKYSKGT